jgi:hypothetical protein
MGLLPAPGTGVPSFRACSDSLGSGVTPCMTKCSGTASVRLDESVVNALLCGHEFFVGSLLDG